MRTVILFGFLLVLHVAAIYVADSIAQNADTILQLDWLHESTFMAPIPLYFLLAFLLGWTLRNHDDRFGRAEHAAICISQWLTSAWVVWTLVGRYLWAGEYACAVVTIALCFVGSLRVVRYTGVTFSSLAIIVGVIAATVAGVAHLFAVRHATNFAPIVLVLFSLPVLVTVPFELIAIVFDKYIYKAKSSQSEPPDEPIEV